MAQDIQPGQVEVVKYDTGAERFFICDDDDIPIGTPVVGVASVGSGVVTKILVLTQAQYDALVDADTVDANTQYNIVEG